MKVQDQNSSQTKFKFAHLFTCTLDGKENPGKLLQVMKEVAQQGSANALN